MTDWPGTEERAWPGTEEPQQNFFDMPEADRRVSRLVPNVANIMKGIGAFGEGFREGLQPETLGLSEESRKWLADKNVLPKDVNDYTNPMKPFMAFNEGIILPLAVGIDTIARSPMAFYRGMQSLAIARGVPPDIASIPDAFMGSPHPLGIPQVQLDPPKPFVKPVDIKPIEGSPNPGILRTEAAKTGDPLIDQILDHPTMKAVIEKPVVDDSHTIPNSLGGSTPINNPTLYRDKDFPKTLTIDGVTFDTAEPSAVHENVEEFVIDALTKSGMDQATALKVAFWNFGEVAEDAWYRVHGMDPEHVEARYTDILNKIASRPVPDEAPETWFHGTPHEFEKFDLNRVKETGEPDVAIALTSSRNLAQSYAEGGGIDTIPRGPGRIIEAKVNFNNPLLIKKETWTSRASQASDIERAKAAGHDGIIYEYTGENNLREALAWNSDTVIDAKTGESLFPKGEGAVSLVTRHAVPPDLFKGTYPDGDPAKAGPGPIDKPTPQEVALGRQMLEKYLAGEGNPSGFVAFHGSPASFQKFNTATVDVTTDQSFAERYREPKAAAQRGKGNLYQVSVGASRDDFLNLDKPLSEQSEQVKAALGKAGVALDKETPERVAAPAIRVGEDIFQGINHGEALDNAFAKHGEDANRAAAIPENQGFMTTKGRFVSRQEAGEIARRQKQTSLDRRPMDAQGGFHSDNMRPEDVVFQTPPQDYQIAGEQEFLLALRRQAKQRLGMDVWDELRDAIGADAAAAKLRDAGIAGTSRQHGVYSVFDPNILQITHVNGQPILDAARDLGVVGSPKAPLTEGKPAEAAARATDRGGPGGPAGPAGPGGGGPAPGGVPPEPGVNPWRDRFEHFVGKLETPDDVKQLIRESADEKGEFPVARQGDIPLAHVEAIAEAAGVEPGEVNQRGLGRLLKNDAEVRTAMQLMLQLTENVKAAARDVRADGSPENLINLQEAIMRRDLAVEQVVGLRAEWGRTGNVFQEFLRDVKDQEALSNFLKDKGRTPKDLQDIADAVDTLDRTQAARFMNNMRTPTGWDNFMWYYVNALISGFITHGKYVVANAAFAGVESAVTTPAGVVGAVRRSLLGGREGVFVGETAARIWGLVAGTPDAIVAAVKAARSGLQTPLPGEIAQNIAPKNATVFQQKPIGGPVGTLIGLPSRGASAIHSFFNFLGYRASMEAQAYRAAAKEGLSPADQTFWERRQSAIDAPTKEMMDNAIEEGYRLTFINDLSPAAQKISSAIKATKAGQVIMPFTHIPFNLLTRGAEYTPLAFIPAETRADLFGRNGAVKQDMAIARLVVGSAVGAWAANMVLNDRMTGAGPTDPKERAQWLATGHQPYSVRIGDEWFSFNRFGPIGTMLGLHSNLAEVIPHLKPDSEELTKAMTMAVHATGRLLEDEVGMQTIAGIVLAIQDPGKEGVRFASNFAGGLLPYSSALRQTASSMDPYMRETKSVVDGLRYYIPSSAVGRQSLLPKRDWLGESITNAGYGGDLPIPGVSSIIQHRPAEASPIAEEMKRLDLHPAVPQNRVGGVQLPPKLYDQYQMAAGQLKRQVLYNWVAQPNWYQMPEFVRAEIFRRSISVANQQAGAMMQGMYPQIIQQGVQQRVDQINGVKPTKLKD